MTLGFWRVSFKSERGNKQNYLGDHFEAVSSIKWPVFCTYLYQLSARELWSCRNPKMNTHAHTFTHTHTRAIAHWKKNTIFKNENFIHLQVYVHFIRLYMFYESRIKHTEKAPRNHHLIYFLLNICFTNPNSGFKIIWNHLHFQCILHSHQSSRQMPLALIRKQILKLQRGGPPLKASPI